MQEIFTEEIINNTYREKMNNIMSLIGKMF